MCLCDHAICVFGHVSQELRGFDDLYRSCADKVLTQVLFSSLLTVTVYAHTTHLIHTTVGYNIKYGSAGATDEEVAEVVQQSNLVDTLSKFPLVRVVYTNWYFALFCVLFRDLISVVRCLSPTFCNILSVHYTYQHSLFTFHTIVFKLFMQGHGHVAEVGGGGVRGVEE